MGPAKVCINREQTSIRHHFPVLSRIEEEREFVILRKRARRCLFGPVNHQEIREIVENARATNVKEQSARWNFDFENGTPLPGRFLWEPVGDRSYPPRSLSPEVSKHIQTAASTHQKKASFAKQKTLHDFFRQQRSVSPAAPSEKRKSLEDESPMPVSKMAKIILTGKK